MKKKGRKEKEISHLTSSLHKKTVLKIEFQKPQHYDSSF